MKPFIRISLLMIAVVFFTACSAPATASPAPIRVENQYAPQAGDSDLIRGDVQIASASLDTAQSQSGRVTVNFAYFPPTPCYQLRVEVGQPDAQNRVNLQAYGVAEKDKACTLMPLATPLPASLTLSGLSKGHYSVWLNGAQVGAFDM
jgi:hypothetical protein